MFVKAVSASDRHRIYGAIPPQIREHDINVIKGKFARGAIVGVKDVVDLQVLVPRTAVTDYAESQV